MNAIIFILVYLLYINYITFYCVIKYKKYNVYVYRHIDEILWKIINIKNVYTGIYIY